MRIFLIGQIALHWGRLEFGNMGNYYIIEPFIREIHRVFPDAEITTVFQMTQEFCRREKVSVLPMELYYGYRENELDLAKMELEEAKKIAMGEMEKPVSLFVREVLSSDFVLDLSGDMWGDNADLAGKNRFEVGLIKDRIVQILHKPIFMLAGSPGPFITTKKNLEFARQVFENFALVTNREDISTKVLSEAGFTTDNVYTCGCPSFLFEPDDSKENFVKVQQLFKNPEKPMIGFILCGWNFKQAPFSMWPRDDSEYSEFVKLIKGIIEYTDANVCLISHSNGFPIPPQKFELQHGRDYLIVEQLNEILQRGNCNRVQLIRDVYNVWQTKGVIGHFDMLVSGRVHGAIAGISQCVPTVIIDYGHEPKAHKLRGFAGMVEMESYIANPHSSEDMLEKARNCWDERKNITKLLKMRIPQVQELARQNMELVKAYMDKYEKM